MQTSRRIREDPSLSLCLSRFHIGVCSLDELHQSRSIDVTVGREFHMAHELAGACQQALRIGNLGTTEEPDIDVSCEGIDIGERRITDTRGRMAIMQYLPNIVSAVAHGPKPALRNRSKFTRMLIHPGFDGWISLDRIGEPHQLAHGN